MTLHEADFLARKGKKPITMLTAYTCPVARGIEAAGVPVILVGDTVGMVEMGFASTRDVTLEHMEYHIGAVRRGAPNTHIIGDLPYLTDADPDTALASAHRLIAAGANSIKLEGPKADVISRLVAHGVPVVGHTGLTPQTATSFKKVGTDDADARRILDEAKLIEDAGAFMVVLEHIPYPLAEVITRTLNIPTIGIGASGWATTGHRSPSSMRMSATPSSRWHATLPPRSNRWRFPTTSSSSPARADANTWRRRRHAASFMAHQRVTCWTFSHLARKISPPPWKARCHHANLPVGRKKA